jgi:hypothetical protein
VDKDKNIIIKEQDDNENAQTLHLDIWENVLNMRLFIGGVLVHDEHEVIDTEKVKKRVMHYY